MSKKKKEKKADGIDSFDIDFDFEGSAVGETNEAEIAVYKQMLEEVNSRVMLYEKYLLDNGLMEEVNSQFISDEEIICTQGIEYIKRLVVQGTFTKDDINAFDVLHRNLCAIRGISLDRKKNRKEEKKSREELLKLVQQRG